MQLSLFDFPLKEKENIIYNKDDKILIDLQKSKKEEIIDFCKSILQPANYGKRFLMKRITRTYHESLEEAKDIASWEFMMKGYKFCKKGEHTLELTVISDIDYLNPKKAIMYLKEDK